MRFRVLGPLEVSGESGPITLGGPKQRAVLAHLLVRANQVVPADALIDQVWGDEPPDAARNTLQSYVSHLRKALGAERLEGKAPGYLLHVDAHELDSLRFESLLSEARKANGRADRAGDLLREALGLWRGPAFADLATEEALAGEIARLEELRLQAVEERLAADLATGRHGEVAGELESLTHQFPLRERLWAHLMLALYRSGRQAEALAAFQRAREVLADELGVDPSPELQRVQERILRQDPDLELKGTPLRGYRLLQQIGQGAFGVVHRAIQPQIGREVAIKAVHPSLANHPDFVRRFEREAQIVAKLEHPHVVPLYDYWREPDAAYLVMRFLRGGSLADLLEQGPLEPARAAGILDQVSSALAAAHRQGIVHRDVKPANVLLDEVGNAYLSDFGVAIDAGSPDQMAGTKLRGTPAYLSPEQMRLEPATARSDVYSLGVVLYEMLAGEPPFRERSLNVLLERHLNDPLPSVRLVRPELPAAVDDVIARATAKAPAGRFADAQDVAAAFRAAVEVRDAGAPPAVEIRNPYKGLRAFLEADAGDFFGREAVTDRLIERLAEEGPGSRFLAVVGPSGSGKSSVVRAGLVPALRRGALSGSERWYVIEMLPGSEPLRELESALIGIAVEPPPSLLETLERDEQGLVRAVDRILPDPGSELLIVIDQLEELFTLTPEPVREHVLSSLCAATEEPGGRIHVVATLRADFYDQPLAVRGFGDLIAARTEAIAPMSPEEIERAIVAPAERAGLRLETGLVGAMVADVADQPGALPLLQYALTELAERREDGVLTLAAYRRIGGVSGALARRAEQLFGAMNEGGREACRQLFLRLVTLGEGTEDTRRRVTRSEVLPLADPRSMEAVIDSFGRHRLLSSDRDPESREPTVEIAHEAMLHAWDRLRGWIEEARDDLRTRNRLAASAGEWVGGERDPSFLLAGARLEQTTAWAESTSVALSSAEHEYLIASVDRYDEEAKAEEARRAHETDLERRSLRRLRGLVAVMTAAALVATALTGIAVRQSGVAERSSRVATARELAGAALANIDVDADRSLLLALQAVETTYAVDGTVLREAEEALHAAVQSDRLLFSVEGNDHADFSADGSRLVTGDLDGAVHVYDATTGRPLLTVPDPGGVLTSIEQQDVAFSPSGSSFVSSSGAVWSSETGEMTLNLHFDETAFSVGFSLDGRFIAGQNDGTVVYDLETGKRVSRIWPYGDVAFAPDGRRLLIADNFGPPDPDRGQVAGYVVDWHQKGGGSHWVTLFGHQGADTRGAAWSPDGSMVATSAPPEVHVWDPTTGEREFTLTASAEFSSVAFSPDSSRMATGMKDGTTIVWNLTPDGATQALTLAGDSRAGDVVFSPDGRSLATASEDGTVAVWDVTPDWDRERVVVPGAQGLAYSSDGRILATSSTTEDPPTPWTNGPADVHLWDAESGRPIATLHGHTDEIIAMDFAPDGTRIASASLDGTTRIWDVATGAPLVTLRDWIPGHPNRPVFVVDIAFSPDGRTVATTTASKGGRIRLWDAATGAPLSTMHDASGVPVAGNYRVDFSQDGRLLAAPSNGALYVWNLATGSVVAQETVPGLGDLAFTSDGHGLLVRSGDHLSVWNTRTWTAEATVDVGGGGGVAVSPIGDSAATLSSDGTLTVWQTDPLREGLVIAAGVQGHQSPHTLAFSPDGTRLAVSVGDTVSVYALDIDDLVDLAHERLTRGFTEQECRQYLHLDRCPSG